MEEQKLYVGVEGVKLILDVSVDISQSDVRKILYKKPVGGISDCWEAEIESYTEISYIFQAGDIDAAGYWEFQSYVETADWKITGDKVRKLVEGPIIPCP